MTTQERVLVLGIGNPLMQDEGIGVRLAEELMAHYEFPDNVELVDAGTMGMVMISLLHEADYVLVVDAVDGTGHPPGTVVRLSPEDMAPNQVLHSLHDIKLVDVLAAAELTGAIPEVDCIGVQIECMSPVELEIGLTPAVEDAVPRAIEAVLTVLAERGIVPGERTEPSPEADHLRAMRLGGPMRPVPPRD